MIPEVFVQRVCGATDAVINELQEELYQNAEGLAESYWTESLRRRAGPNQERPAFALKLERQKAGVGIYWRRVSFVRVNGDKKWALRTTHVPLGTTKDRYLPGKFRAAPAWEREMINQLEEQFEVIRKISRYLGRTAQMARSGVGWRARNAPEART